MAIGRKTGGRKAGTPNKATVERELRAAQGVQIAFDDGLMPLDIMLARMRDEPLPNGHMVSNEQFEAACAAAPYLHPKLAATTLKGDRDNPLQYENAVASTDQRLSIESYLAEFVPEVHETDHRTVLALPQGAAPACR